MPVTEQDALRAMEAARLAADDPARVAKAKGIVDAYRTEQSQLGKPLFPAYYQAKADDQKKVRSFFQDRDRHGLDEDQYKEVAQTLQDPEKKARFFNEQFLARTFNRPTQEIRKLGAQYRDEYALQAWGEPVKTEGEFYQKLGEDFDTEDQIADLAQTAALQGVPAVQAWAQVPDEIKTNPAFQRRRKALLAEFEETAAATDARISPYRQTVTQTIEDLRETMKGAPSDAEQAGAALSGGLSAMGAEAGREISGAMDFRDFAQRLVEIPKEDRELVIAAIIAGAGEGDAKGPAQKLAENFARGAQSIAADTVGAIDRTALRQLQSFANQGAGVDGDATTVQGYLQGLNARLAAASDPTGAAALAAGMSEKTAPSEEIRAEAAALIETQMEAIDVANDLQQIADGVIDPAKGEYMVTRGLYAAARSIPYTLVAMAPGGIALNTVALSEQSYQTMRRANPDMSRDQAMAISAIAGPIQAGLEQIPAAMLAGKLPTLGRFMNKAVATTGGAATRFGVRTAEGVAIEMVQENLQDLTPFAVQGAIAALSDDMPDVPWNEVYGGDFWNQQGELFFATLPLALIGAGAGTVRDFTAARSLMHDPRAVSSIIGNEAKASEIAEAAEAGNYNKAQSLLREGMREVKADRSDLMAVRQKAAAELQADAARKSATITRAEDVGVLPAIGRTAEGWSLKFNDGTARTFENHQEADAARWKYTEDAGLNVAEATRSVIQSVESQLEAGREVAFTFVPERRTLLNAVQEGEVSQEAAQRRGQIAEDVGGQTPNVEQETEIDPEQEYQESFTAAELAAITEDDKLALFQILGSNKTEFADGVQRTTIKLFQGATPLTVIEEKLEGDASAMITGGKRDWLLYSLIRYQRTSGDKVFREGITRNEDITDADLKEAWSHLGQSYFVGRSRKGDVGDRWKSRNFRKAAAELLRSPVGAAMDGYARFFQSVWKRAAKLNKLRREGKLDAELERELARSVGFGEQAEYEASVESEAGQNRQALEDMGFEAEVGESSFEPTDDAPFSVIQQGEGYKKTAMPDGMILEGPASFSVIAYHGTPHKVDKFTTGKIGTGEGAQAYGWGLYFAANKGVALSYKEALSYNVATTAEEKRGISETRDVINLAKAHIQTAGSVPDAIPLIEKSILATDGKSPELNRKLRAAKNIISEENFSVPEKGNLYTVELLPNDDEFLDWDKPLSEQSERVKVAFSSLVEDMPKGYGDSPRINTTEGAQIYKSASFAFQIAKAKAALREAKDKQQAEYWAFTRQKNAKPVNQETAAAVVSAENALKDALKGRAKTSPNEATEYLSALGIKGIRFLDGNSRDERDGTYNYVIFDDSLVRILEENGQPVTDEPSFSVITNAIDSEYLALAKDPKANREQLLAMVDEAAKKAGYNVGPVTHATNADNFTVFRKGVRPGLSGKGIYFSTDGVGIWGRNIRNFYLKINSPLTRENAPHEVNNGHRSAVIPDVFDIFPQFDGVAIRRDEVTVKDPNQIKSADPVTYDADGNIIPLSQRFDPSRDEITYSVITNAESRIAESFNPFLRNPEQRRKIVLEAQKRSAEQARGFQEIIRFNRSGADIERERKTREADILEEKLGTLSPSEIGALEATGTLDDVGMRPILSDLLREKFYKTKSGKTVRYWRGSLMSKSAAKADGIDTTQGEWDGIPEGLPPYVWGGSIMPDQAATQFGFDSVDEFWTALSAEIDSYKNLKADTKAAMTRIRELEREAKAESREWAEEQKKLRRTVGTDRATLIAAMRTLDAMISALPSEIRGKVGGFVRLAQFKTPGAMLDELERRANRLDTELERWLKKEADKGVKKLFERAKPAKDESGKKRVGKAGADIHDLFETARTAWKNWDAEKAEAHAVGIEAEVAKGELSPEWEAHKLLEAELVRSFGGWNQADSVRKNHALDTATEIWDRGYLEYREKKAKEKERRYGIRSALRADTGKAGKKSERALTEMAGVKLPGQARDFFLSLLNFEQLTQWAFGKESKWAQWFADEQRKAENAKLDAVQAVTEGVEDLFTELAGGNRFKGEQLQYRMMQRSMTATAADGDVVPLSELEALSALLMWQQEDGRRHLRGKRDENGNITSTWAYDEDFIDEISGKLSPEAWRVLGYLQQEYGKEYGPLNAVYRDVYGINLPQNANYSPLTVKPTQAAAGQTADPLTGSTVSTGSFTPGSLRSRAQVSAEPDFRDAVATFIAHKKQIEHWKAHSRFVLDANAVLGNREVGNSIEAAHGQEAVKIIRKWLDAIAQGGVRNAANDTALMRAYSNAVGRASGMALVGRIGTIAIQSTQLAAASALMPTGAYVVRLGKLLSGNLSWKTAMASTYIQRRLKEQPVMVQAAMEGLKAGKPTQIKHQVRKLGSLLNGADALFTAGTYAMVHDYHFTKAKRDGMTDAEAEGFATETAERVVESVAQPTRLGTRSFYEVSMNGPMARLVWAFASDARKNVGLLGFTAAKGDKGDFKKAVLFAVVLNSILASVIRNAWRDARDGEDDELFDEKYWNSKRILLSLGTDWMGGIPAVGEEVQRAVFAMSGEYTPNGGLLSAVAESPMAVKNLVTGDSADYLRDIEKIMSAIGLYSDNTAALTSVMHLVRDIYGLGENFISE